jgi:hypothetical protein
MKRSSRKSWKNASCPVDPVATREGLKRKMSGYPLRPRTRGPTLRLPIPNHIRIIK